MTPSKTLYKDASKDLMEKYKITFEGPLLPKDWPAQYKHHFSVIRKIWATRYDEYATDPRIDKSALRENRRRVKSIRSKARSLRTDTNPTENNWRSYVDQVLKGRFEEISACEYCKCEYWTADYQAEPLDESELKRLRKKRSLRTRCLCNQRGDSMDREPENSDEDASGNIFRALERNISQHPDVASESVSIPMRPDLTIGLDGDRYKSYLPHLPPHIVHSPMQKVSLLYPFLLVEAKRGDNAPGFRSIEAQTAFPLRRVLEMQDELLKASTQKFDPLVWFFAYQGEECRLYAGIIESSKVRVFDLWVGIIESYDGALQLIQITDFIWTWARDLYRPWIRKCLHEHYFAARGHSPSSSDALTRSQSILSDQGLGNPGNISESVSCEPQRPVWSQEPDSLHFTIERGALHHLNRGFSSQDSNESWASQLSVKFGSVILCSFHVLEILSWVDMFRNSAGQGSLGRQVLTQLASLIYRTQHTIPLKRSDIAEVQREWWDTESARSIATPSSPHEILNTFFFSQNFVDGEDWQVRREIYCIAWSEATASTIERLSGVRREDGHYRHQPTAYAQGVTKEILRVRNLLGVDSVKQALGESTFVLTRSDSQPSGNEALQWTAPPSQGVNGAAILQYRSWFQPASSNSHPLASLHHCDSKLLRIRRTGFAPKPSDDQVSAMFIVKPDYWPSTTPRFCLFLLDEGEIDEASLGHLLRNAIETETYNASATGEPPSFTASDRGVISSWLSALGAS